MSLAGIDCVGYLRVSTKQQAGPQKTSLDTQRAEVERYAAANGRTVGRWYVDPGVSGATAEARPAFSELLAHCTDSVRSVGAPRLILAQDVSRWGRFERDTESALVTLRCERAGWLVRFADEGPLDMSFGAGALPSDTVDAIQSYLYERLGRLSTDPLRAMLAGLLVGATTEARAIALLRLCEDYDERRGSSAIMRVLHGQVDIVTLLALFPYGQQ